MLGLCVYVYNDLFKQCIVPHGSIYFAHGKHIAQGRQRAEAQTWLAVSGSMYQHSQCSKHHHSLSYYKLFQYIFIFNIKNAQKNNKNSKHLSKFGEITYV